MVNPPLACGDRSLSPKDLKKTKKYNRKKGLLGTKDVAIRRYKSTI
jgi:hypothetical protein